MGIETPAGLRLRALNGVIDRDVAAQSAVDRAWSLRFEDANEMLDWALLARELAVAPRMRARASAHLGNAYRICGRFEEARRHLGEAGQLEGDLGPLLLEFKASLLENVGEFGESLACLRVAGRLRAEAGDADGEARVLATRGHILTEAGLHLEAARVFCDALEKVVSDEDIARVAIHGLAHALAKSGQPARGLEVLDAGRPVVEKGQFLYRLRVAWLLGRIAMVCESDEVALESLEEARAGFCSEGLTHETCLVTLDLAIQNARCGRKERACELLEPIPELLSQIGVACEAEVASAVRFLLEGRFSSALAVLNQIMSVVEA
jgi:tetratricopeptide (TPR) repeat protein